MTNTNEPTGYDYEPQAQGTKQPRLTLSVPTDNSKIVLGDRDADNANFIGISAITDGVLYLSSTGVDLASQPAGAAGVAVVQGYASAMLQSTNGPVTVLGQTESLFGSQGDAHVTSGGNVDIVAGFTPPITPVIPAQDGQPVLPAVSSTPDFSVVADHYNKAAKLTAATMGIITGVFGLVNTLRDKTNPGSIGAYTLMSIGVLSNLKSTIEGSSDKRIFALGGANFKSDWWQAPASGGLTLHGEQFVNIHAGTFSSISMFADSGSVTGIGAVTAGLIGGIAATLTGGIAATVTGALAAGMTSGMASTVVSWGNSSVEARTGTATVRGPLVQLGQALPPPPAPQMPTIQVNIDAADKIAATVGGASATATLSATSGVSIQSPLGVTITVGAFEINVSMGGITISTAAPPMSTVKVGLEGVKLSVGPASIAIDPTGGVKITTPGQLQISGTMVQVSGTARLSLG